MAHDEIQKPASGELGVGGFVPFTTVDYPGRLAAVIFCAGCPWRCSYCHNPHLQSFSAREVPWSEISENLAARKGFLEAVVFSGGEPTAQNALPGAMREVKEMGFLVGLHTAGMFPERLERALPLADWVGFDVKAPFGEIYDRLTGVPGSAENTARSLGILLGSGVDYQIRTTRDPEFLDSAACDLVETQLREAGATPTVWQTCRR